MPAQKTCPHGRPLSRCVLNISTHWRLQESDNRPLPTFFVHDAGGNASLVRDTLRVALGGNPAEAAIPNVWSQLLVDAPLMEALLTHPRRVRDVEAAAWHIADAMPFASYVLGKLGLLGGEKAHALRMHDVAKRLGRNRYWKNHTSPWLILQPFYVMDGPLGKTLGDSIRQRGARTIVATVDRSAYKLQGQGKRYMDVFMRALELPHVATPELAAWAQACAPSQLGTSAAPGSETPNLLESCDSGRPRDGRDSNVKAASLSRRREGFLFHGDMGRFDFGARTAMRDISTHLMANMSLASRTLSRGTGRATPIIGAGGVLEVAPAQTAFREVSRSTSAAMLRSAVCMAPQGDIMSSRRLYDSLAAGCVPVVIKALGNSRTELALGNVPFHHSINWQSLAFFLLPRATRQGNTPADARIMVCRAEEAGWLNRRYQDRRLLAQMRHNAVAAFQAYMNVERNPAGVATAVLRELAHILDEPPRDDLVHLGKTIKTDWILNAHRVPERLLRRPVTETHEMAIPELSGVT